MVILKMCTKPVNFAYVGNSNCVKKKVSKWTYCMVGMTSIPLVVVDSVSR